MRAPPCTPHARGARVRSGDAPRGLHSLLQGTEPGELRLSVGELRAREREQARGEVDALALHLALDVPGALERVERPEADLAREGVFGRRLAQRERELRVAARALHVVGLGRARDPI